MGYRPWKKGGRRLNKLGSQTLEERRQERLKELGMQTLEERRLERLKELGLQTLDERRHQADRHMMHKIIHNGGGLNYKLWFEEASDDARSTSTSSDPLSKLYNLSFELCPSRRSLVVCRTTHHKHKKTNKQILKLTVNRDSLSFNTVY